MEFEKLKRASKQFNFIFEPAKAYEFSHKVDFVRATPVVVL